MRKSFIVFMIGSDHFTALLLALCKWSFSMISSSSMKFTIALILAPLHGQSLRSSWHYIHVNFFFFCNKEKINSKCKHRLKVPPDYIFPGNLSKQTCSRCFFEEREENYYHYGSLGARYCAVYLSTMLMFLHHKRWK